MISPRTAPEPQEAYYSPEAPKGMHKVSDEIKRGRGQYVFVLAHHEPGEIDEVLRVSSQTTNRGSLWPETNAVFGITMAPQEVTEKRVKRLRKRFRKIGYSIVEQYQLAPQSLDNIL